MGRKHQLLTERNRVSDANYSKCMLILRTKDIVWIDVQVIYNSLVICHYVLILSRTAVVRFRYQNLKNWGFGEGV